MANSTLLFAISTEQGGGEPYVIGAAHTARGLARELMPYLLQCCDEKGLYVKAATLIEQALAEDEWQVEVFVPDSDEEDKSGMSFMLQRGTPEIGN